jgi:hypothetical protein
MADVNDYVRSFGMSGFQLTDEFRLIEDAFQIELGHVPKTEANAPLYYPQFEEAVRRAAADMSEHYKVFYCLEQAIRKLIAETLEDAKGIDWWNSGSIPPAIVQSAAENQKKELENGLSQRSERAIDYTNFGELAVIINHNWTEFESTLKNKGAVGRILYSLNLIRGPIAHCCPMQDDEIDRLRLAVKDWFRQIG